MTESFPQQATGQKGNAMGRDKGIRNLCRTATLVTAVAVLLTAACSSTPDSTESPWRSGAAPPEGLPQRRLEGIKKSVRSEAALWNTLTARCQVAISSPIIRMGENNRVTVQGTLWLKKPGMVRMELDRRDRELATLVGDGRRYLVNMPMFQGSPVYRGTYGDELTVRSDRLLFMPDDLAAALDLGNLFTDKAQVLRTYVAPPQWHVDSLQFSQDPPDIWATSSLVINRNSGQPSLQERYERDGELRTRIRYHSRTLVPAGSQEVQIPDRFTLEYPKQHTFIAIKLTDIRLNQQLSDDRFSVQ